MLCIAPRSSARHHKHVDFTPFKSILNAVISKAISDCAALLPLKSLKFPDIFSQSLRNRLKFSQLPTHLCTHFCPALRPPSLQNPSPFLSDRVRPPLHPSSHTRPPLERRGTAEIFAPARPTVTFLLYSELVPLQVSSQKTYSF